MAAAIFLGTISLFGGLGAVLLATALVMMIAIAWYDLTEFRVPNKLSYPGTLLMLGAAATVPGGDFMGALSGAVVGGVVFLALSLASRGTVGVGDAKMAAFGGATVGLNQLLPALLVGSMVALLPVVFLLGTGRINRRQPLPYAPALVVGFVVIALMTGSTLDL